MRGAVVIGWGITLIVFGAGSLLLPLLGWQFAIMEIVDDFQPYAGMVVAVIGAALVLLGMRREGTTATSQPPAGSSTPADATGRGEGEGRP
jgi:putative Mn2+ efflux pump MntP